MSESKNEWRLLGVSVRTETLVGTVVFLTAIALLGMGAKGLVDVINS